MSRETALIILGILVALTPYLGVPLSILSIILPVLGLIVAAVGVTLRMRNSQTVRQMPERVLPAYEAPEA